MALGKLDIHMQKHEAGPFPYTFKIKHRDQTWKFIS